MPKTACNVGGDVRALLGAVEEHRLHDFDAVGMEIVQCLDDRASLRDGCGSVTNAEHRVGERVQIDVKAGNGFTCWAFQLRNDVLRQVSSQEATRGHTASILRDHGRKEEAMSDRSRQTVSEASNPTIGDPDDEFDVEHNRRHG